MNMLEAWVRAMRQKWTEQLDALAAFLEAEQARYQQQPNNSNQKEK